MAHAARAMTALEIPGKLESAYAAPQTGDRGVGAARTERERYGPCVAASSARAVCACLFLIAWGVGYERSVSQPGLSRLSELSF